MPPIFIRLKYQFFVWAVLVVIGVPVIFIFLQPLQEYPSAVDKANNPKHFISKFCTGQYMFVDEVPFTQSSFHMLKNEYGKYLAAKRNYDEFARYFACESLTVKLFL